MKKQLNYKSLNTLGDVDITQSVVPGGGAGESTMEYLDISGVDNTIKQLLITFSLLDKIPNTVKVNIPVDDGTRTITLKQGIAPGANVGIIMGQVGLDNPDLAMIINGITALSIDFQMNLDIDGQKLPISEFFVLYGIAETIAAIPRITKEQFYKLSVALTIYSYYEDAMEHQDEMKFTFDTLLAIWERDGIDGQYLAITIPNANIESVTKIAGDQTSAFNITSIRKVTTTYFNRNVTYIEFNGSNNLRLVKDENIDTGEIIYLYENMV